MLLQISNLKKSFGERVIFEGVSFTLDAAQKLSIVGVNGAGKTTLIRTILKEIEPDRGSVTMPGGTTVGYIAQEQGLDSNLTVMEELMRSRPEVLELEERMSSLRESMEGVRGDASLSASGIAERYSETEAEYARIGGYEYKSRVTGAVRGLSLDDIRDRVVSTLSGGEKTKVALGKALIREPELLILDEPTNHLDMDSVIWLESMLSSFKGALIAISHDRYFLDKISDRILEIENGKAFIYKGNYSAYAGKKAEKRKAEMRLYLKQQDEIRHQEEVIEKLRSFNREKSVKRAESRAKALEKIDRIERPEDEKGIRITFTPFLQSGKDVLTVEALTAAYDGSPLFENQFFTIRRGERVCVIGKNGSGKSTLLKMINGLISPVSGHIYKGVNVHIGYYDQEFKNLGTGTVFDEVSDRRPDLKESVIRTSLAAFRFLGDDVFKKIPDLSGGERGRLSLLCLMLGKANLLILDEPTNHLDITSREVLEDALSAYEGTVLSVSHDRYFINRTATRVLSLENGQFLDFPGNYDYYLEKRENVSMTETRSMGQAGTRRDASGSGKAVPRSEASASGKAFSQSGAYGSAGPGSASPAASPGEASRDSGREDWLSRKSRLAAERKQKADIEACEKKIEEIEEQIKAIDARIMLPENATRPSALSALSKERDDLSGILSDLYDKWDALQEQL
ncbi:MAG: ABC-F family ATP-binding cassette domain-containing protein [Lachnospiraceae bacterium]|nr:ABC-F family ATP-binding cassette domain-containing protein [Lachnospiraceae bacterium]